MNSQSPGEFLTREMTVEDLPGADQLRRLAGWNQTLADWRRLLSLDPGGCFAAVREGRIVGSVTTTTHGPSLAWIGMMLVHPDFRGRGIGARLMEAALGRLERDGLRVVKLDATPLGLPLYQKFGFVPETTLERWQRDAAKRVGAGSRDGKATRRLTESDWAAVGRLDAAAFGAARPGLLRSLAEGARAVLVWPEAGPVAGYGMLRPGDRADYLGPGVCGDSGGAAALAEDLLREAGARPVFWDVLDPCASAKEAASRFGFIPARPLTRMRRGPEAAAGDLAAQLAIADPAVG